ACARKIDNLFARAGARIFLWRKLWRHACRVRNSCPRSRHGCLYREMMGIVRAKLLKFAIWAALIAITWTVFGQTIGHQFVNYDDPLYVLENARVRAGLNWHGVAWAFTHVHSQNWHPLTSISHMLDCQLFGVQPGWHHFVNVLLHSAGALLLFLFLEQMTGSPSSPRDESM